MTTLFPELMIKVAYYGIAAKPIHELTPKEIRQRRKNLVEERKTTESKVLRGIGYGAGGVAGGVMGAATEAAARGADDSALKALRERYRGKLDFERKTQFDDTFAKAFPEKHRKKQQALAALEAEAKERVGKMESEVARRAKGTGGRFLRRTAVGTAAGAGAIYGLDRLGHHLAKRRLDRELKRR